MKHDEIYKFGMWASVSQEEWDDWRWQLRNAIHNVNDLNSILSSFTDFRVPVSPIVNEVTLNLFEFKVTPHMVWALKRAIENSISGAIEAFRWSFTPSDLEINRLIEVEDETDGIGEEIASVNPVPAITNFYKNRVLFRVTTMCPAYCRYCLRRRMLGDGTGVWNERNIKEGIRYIANNTDINEVILSGGDPLVLSDERLFSIISELKKIPHIKRLRIDTKALTMMPQRVTNGLIDILRNNQPFYVIVHFSHPYELTDETRKACNRLADAGIPLGSHTPLIKGVSDNEQTLTTLMDELVNCRVQPYYLIHFIPTKWTEHFRVPLSRGMELIRHIFKTCGGLATPTYIVYLPDAGGKVPVQPQYILEHRSDGYIFESMDGRRILYPEPDVLG